MASVLIVDADPALRSLAKQILEGAGVVCILDGDTAEAVQAAHLNRPDGVLLEIGASLEGVAASRAIKAERSETKVVLLTGRHEEAFLASTGKTGADALLPKTALNRDLLATLRRLGGPVFGKLWDGMERRADILPRALRSGNERRLARRHKESRHGSG